MSKFQVQLNGKWTDYVNEENLEVLNVFASGVPVANIKQRGQQYMYDFVNMIQTNVATGKTRKIRPPFGLKARGLWPPQHAPTQHRQPQHMPQVSQPINDSSCIVMKVPPHATVGSKIVIAHPQDATVKMEVVVPPGAAPGMSIQVPVPALPVAKSSSGAAAQGGLVTLHVYDLGKKGSKVGDAVTAVNGALDKVGAGVVHVGVEVYGREWSFGACGSGTGVFSQLPKHHATCAYREANDMGITKMSATQVETVLERLKAEWQGAEYDLFQRNCLDFSDTFCRELGVGPIPEKWKKAADMPERLGGAKALAAASYLSGHVMEPAKATGLLDDAAGAVGGAARDAGQWVENVTGLEAAGNAGDWVAGAAQDVGHAAGNAGEWVGTAALDVGDELAGVGAAMAAELGNGAVENVANFAVGIFG